MPADRTILLTGATGYVGGRLVRLLVQDGWSVCCLDRRPGRLAARLRGWIDLAIGGVGLRRGRRDPTHFEVGDTLDWRVEDIRPGQSLRLTAEMKLPGRTWLDFEIDADGSGSRLRQTAIFDPVGLWGLAYWYGVWPLHQIVFAGMLRGLASAAEESA
jgi:hypothetical protein